MPQVAPFPTTFLYWVLLLARLFNSPWHNYSTMAGTIVQPLLALLLSSHWHYCSTVTGTILQQSLVRLFNICWRNYSTVAGTIVKQSLARLFNSHWHVRLTVASTVLQQFLTRFFNSHWQDFSFFYTGRILQQWWSLLNNPAMYQKYDTKYYLSNQLSNQFHWTIIAKFYD